VGDHRVFASPVKTLYNLGIKLSAFPRNMSTVYTPTVHRQTHRIPASFSIDEPSPKDQDQCSNSPATSLATPDRNYQKLIFWASSSLRTAIGA
jgi:hypothetical protein